MNMKRCPQQVCCFGNAPAGAWRLGFRAKRCAHGGLAQPRCGPSASRASAACPAYAGPSFAAKQRQHPSQRQRPGSSRSKAPQSGIRSSSALEIDYLASSAELNAVRTLGG